MTTYQTTIDFRGGERVAIKIIGEKAHEIGESDLLNEPVRTNARFMKELCDRAIRDGCTLEFEAA